MRPLVIFSRVLLALIFVLSGFNKLRSFHGTAGYFAHSHMPAPGLATVIAIVVELVGGILLIIGLRAGLVALIMAIYLVGATYYGHIAPGFQQMEVLKNIAIMGGLLHVTAYEWGRGWRLGKKSSA